MSKATTRLLVLACAVGLALAGCTASNQPDAAAESTPPPSATAAASVDRWASAIAEAQATLDDWKGDWEDAGCSVSDLDNILCNASMTSGGFVAGTVYAQVATPSTSSSINFLGTPPDEISTLYTSTLGAAITLRDAGDAYTAGRCIKMTETCFELALDLDSAMDAMSKKFAGWQPYL